MSLTLSLAGRLGMTLTNCHGARASACWRASSHRRPADWLVMLGQPARHCHPCLLAVDSSGHRPSRSICGWLPPGGFPGLGDPVAALRALVLPTLALAVVQAAVLGPRDALGAA